jgi:hypothetical protein
METLSVVINDVDQPARGRERSELRPCWLVPGSGGKASSECKGSGSGYGDVSRIVTGWMRRLSDFLGIGGLAALRTVRSEQIQVLDLGSCRLFWGERRALENWISFSLAALTDRRPYTPGTPRDPAALSCLQD